MKRDPKKEAEKAQHELPPRLQKYGIKTSWPHGAYPPDVDAALEQLENDNATLVKDNIRVTNELKKLQQDFDDLRQEHMKLRMGMALLDVSDVSAEASATMLNKMSGISKSFVEETPVLDEEELERRTNNQKRSKETLANIAQPSVDPDELPVEKPTSTGPLVFNDLLRPKKGRKNNGGEQ